MRGARLAPGRRPLALGAIVRRQPSGRDWQPCDGFFAGIHPFATRLFHARKRYLLTSAQGSSAEARNRACDGVARLGRFRFASLPYSTGRAGSRPRCRHRCGSGGSRAPSRREASANSITTRAKHLAIESPRRRLRSDRAGLVPERSRGVSNISRYDKL